MDIFSTSIAANSSWSLFDHGFTSKQAVTYSIIVFPGQGPGVLNPVAHATLTQGETCPRHRHRRVALAQPDQLTVRKPGKTMGAKMAKISVTIVHDELGHIVSVSRPAKTTAFVLAGDGQSVFTAQIDEETAPALLHTHRVDTNQQALIKI